jgi:hypothetical protein
MVLHCSLCLIYATHFRPGWSLPQHPSQLVDLRLITDDVDFHIAVIQISNPASKPYRVRSALDEVAKANPLHAASNPIDAR